MNTIVWNIDPTIFTLGPLQLRYYGIIFASMLYIGFIIWRRQMLRAGYSLDATERFLVWGVIAVLVGSRLGHCLFYEPVRFLKDPITILYVWKGGLASHGATAGLVVALILFALKYKIPIIEVLDRLSMSSAVGAAAVRLGNFFNSEIVGRPTDLPWAVRFPLYDCRGGRLCDAAVPRHPSQLYEFAFGLFVLLVLYLADRFAGREKRPRGLLAGLFLTVYFSGRFTVEFVKEYQTLEESFLTMGQYLSIIPVLCGIGLLVVAAKNAAKPATEAKTNEKSAPLEHRIKTKKKPKAKKRGR
ncbi:MAG: prolipoprotein diacylglyceryl transferase [Proteobacteria bacterium]|nr:prolipoprotein diacylglyceryl transferase [Pseudomonadota bacterium]